MPVVIVVGAQWGDEGKGKVVDLLAERAEMVVRYGGGANAGHTLVIGGHKLVTHLVPSGVLHRHVRCVLGDGMVVDPHTLLEEIAACRQRGLLGENQLLISSRAHVILPYHRWLEAAREERAGAIGTTRRGIGPAYESKAARRGVRVSDLGRPARLRELVQQNLDEIGPILTHWGQPLPGRAEIDALIADAERAGQELAPMVGDAGRAVDAAVRSGRNVLFEGAQGTLLDIDNGTYPFVTSSSTVAGGACAGAGVGADPHRPGRRYHQGLLHARGQRAFPDRDVAGRRRKVAAAAGGSSGPPPGGRAAAGGSTPPRFASRCG